MTNPQTHLTESSFGQGSIDHRYVSFRVSVARAYEQFGSGKGRASRSEYWWFQFHLFLVGFTVSLVSAVAFWLNLITTRGLNYVFIALGLFLLSTVVPGISITIRRLHDLNLSGWLWWINAIPVIGSFLIFVLMLLPSSPRDNRYGPNAVNTPRQSGVWWRYLTAVLAFLFAILPIVWVILAAVNPAGTLSTLNLHRSDFGLDNFRFLFGKHDLSNDVTYENYPYLHWYKNSLMISSIAAILQVTVATLAAYAFSRITFKGRRLSLGGLLVLQMFPQILSFIALFLIMQKIGAIFPFMGTGTIAGLILIYLGGAMGYNTYLLKGFFDTIPRELDEAAIVDGATANQIFFKIILPLAAPMLAVVMLLSFIGLMNDFVLASIFLTKTDQMTLAVGLRAFISGRYASNWGVFAAGALLAALPVVILFQVLQRYIVEGLSAGSVKG